MQIFFYTLQQPTHTIILIIAPNIAKLYSVVCNSEGIQTRAVSTIGEISSWPAVWLGLDLHWDNNK